jgi:hypothetical protein
MPSRKDLSAMPDMGSLMFAVMGDGDPFATFDRLVASGSFSTFSETKSVINPDGTSMGAGYTAVTRNGKTEITERSVMRNGKTTILPPLKQIRGPSTHPQIRDS